MPSRIASAFAALWHLDLAFADVVSTSTDAHLAAIRLAWWRERLEELDTGAVPAEPTLQGVALHLLPRGVTGAELSMLEDAWRPMLAAFPWTTVQAGAFQHRGRLLFGLGARILGGDPVLAAPAGELWSLHDGAVHCSDPQARAMLEGAATMAIGQLPPVTPPKLRPLTMLATLAVSELKPGGRWRRGVAALRHRISGRYPVG